MTIDNRPSEKRYLVDRILFMKLGTIDYQYMIVHHNEEYTMMFNKLMRKTIPELRVEYARLKG